jgi:hypothetical protein
VNVCHFSAEIGWNIKLNWKSIFSFHSLETEIKNNLQKYDSVISPDAGELKETEIKFI